LSGRGGQGDSCPEGGVLGLELGEAFSQQLEVCFAASPGGAQAVQFCPGPIERALCRLVSSTLGLERRVRLGQRGHGCDEIGLQLSGVFDCPSEIVAVHERFFDCCGLFLAAVPSTERPHPVGVGPPFAWPSTFARDRHGVSVTKRND
jgi:hypothetical protein